VQVPCDLRVSVIFKAAPVITMRISAVSHGAIKGDANAARFLCRHFGHVRLVARVKATL
jgi:hypothetical protein